MEVKISIELSHLNADQRNLIIGTLFLSQSILAVGYLEFYGLEACLKFRSVID